MNHHISKAGFTLRIALAVTFLSSVASRFGLWGSQSSGWEDFVAYTAQITAFVPESLTPLLAASATVLEIFLAVLLLIGYKIRFAAFGSALLTLLFAMAMTISFGLKPPLDYSVFVFSASAWLLASIPDSHPLSVDRFLADRIKKINLQPTNRE